MTKTEYTKIEIRILSPKFEKKIKIVLWVGILCICISLLLVPSFLKRIDKIKKSYTEIQNDITKIQTETKHEARLKKLLIDGATREKDFLLKFAVEKTFRPIAYGNCPARPKGC